MDILGPEPEDQGPSMDTLQVVAGAACDYGTEGFVARPLPVRASRRDLR
jgi:hypothetical protein